MKKLLRLALVVLVFLPTNVFAQSDGGGVIPDEKPRLTPVKRCFSISFGEDNREFSILFMKGVDQVSVTIYKDGVMIELENRALIPAGTILSYSFMQDGCYTAYIKIGDMEYIVLDEVID